MIRFAHPFTMMVSGPSGCGKTTFISNLIKSIDLLIDKPIQKIIWCNNETNALPKKINFSNIEYINGVPETVNNEMNEPILIILDDLMLDAYNAKVCELFTKGSHHRNLSIILINQNVFHQGKFSRDISLNCKYLVLFKNPRDKSQIMPLARQIFPENTREFIRVYNDATSSPYGYLILDLTQDINDIFRFRSNIFNKYFTVCYCTQKQLQDKNLCSHNETIKNKPAYFACIKKL